MAIFDGIMEQIRTRKRQAAKSSRQKYLDLLRSVASGKESDLESALDVIQSVDRSEDDFAKDVSTMQKRFVLATQHQTSKQIQASIPALERAQEDAQRKLDAAVAELQPRLQAAAQKVRDAHNQIMQFSLVESQLQASCLDLELLEREAELLAMRNELVRSRSPLDDDLRAAKSRLRGCQQSIENWEAWLAKNRHDLPAVAKNKMELSQARAQQEHLSETVSDLAAAIDAINDELKPVEQEIESIRKAKLLP